MRITMRKDAYEKMLSAARGAAPQEAFGLLGGGVGAGRSRAVESVYVLTNADHSNVHL